MDLKVAMLRPRHKSVRTDEGFWDIGLQNVGTRSEDSMARMAETGIFWTRLLQQNLWLQLIPPPTSMEQQLSTARNKGLEKDFICITRGYQTFDPLTGWQNKNEIVSDCYVQGLN